MDNKTDTGEFIKKLSEQEVVAATPEEQERLADHLIQERVKLEQEKRALREQGQ